MAQTQLNTVAVWGCGGRGRLHTGSALALDGITFVAAADPYQDAAERFVTDPDRPEFHGAAHYTDPAAMLAEHQPDLVILATRPADREALIRACCEAGVKAVYAEKPLATSWGEARRIREIVDASTLRLGISHQRRYLDMFTQARRVLQDGLIGEPTLLDARAANLFDWGTHLLDAMLFVTDNRPVHHAMGQFLRQPLKPVFDQPTERAGVFHYNLQGDGPGGLPAVLRTEHDLVHDAKLRIVGEAGIVEASVHANQGVRLLRDHGPGHWEQLPVDDNTAVVSNRLAVADFVSCVEAGKPCRIDLDQAMRATELIFAGLLSAVRGDRVDLPLEDHELPIAELMEGRLGPAASSDTPTTTCGA